MSQLTLAYAEQLAKAAIAQARRDFMNSMCVSVIDVSGHLKFALREDGAPIAGVDIAQGKARAALNFGCTSKQIADALSGNALAGPSVLAVLDGKVVLLAGGAPIVDKHGHTVGALGAAGDMPDRDEAVVLAALAG